jgi:hypothetical protein
MSPYDNHGDFEVIPKNERMTATEEFFAGLAGTVILIGAGIALLMCIK